MDPSLLIDRSGPPLPAPVWFIELFKMLGFSLHAVPMNLWYAGVVLSMILAAVGTVNGKRWSARLMAQMPVIIAMGVNFGIVPLLFIQVAYPQVFYPATILMAWSWFAVIVLLLPAYYGVYIYAFGLREGRMTWWKRLAGWIAALLFLKIGFLFANGLSLMENVAAWPALWHSHGYHGAALGTALNIADPRLWPRWLLMFGLALTTTGAWAVFDAAWFARHESSQYRAWARRFGLAVYTIGILWFAAAGSFYAFKTWPADLRQTMFSQPWLYLTVTTMLAPGLPWLLILLDRRGDGLGRGMASLIGLAQFGVLGLNAVSRQLVQNLELNRYFQPLAQLEKPQWGPMAMFLTLFVLGVGVVIWLIAQVASLPPEPDASGS